MNYISKTLKLLNIFHLPSVEQSLEKQLSWVELKHMCSFENMKVWTWLRVLFFLSLQMGAFCYRWRQGSAYMSNAGILLFAKTRTHVAWLATGAFGTILFEETLDILQELWIYRKTAVPHPTFSRGDILCYYNPFSRALLGGWFTESIL